MVKSRTRPKELLLDIFASLPQGQHISAQELRDRIIGQGGEVSLSTIYRALERLSEQGEIRSIMSARGQLWEAVSGEEHHDHLICTKCGLTIEFHDDLLSGFGQTVAERKGYIYQESRFDIFGFCKDCKANLDSNTVSQVLQSLDNVSTLLDEGKRVVDAGVRSLMSDKDRSVAASIERARKLLQQSVDECERALDALEEEI
ncbi:transcriptional repressor [Candidatus Obscuribacterales bacterium]|jgi:Fur family ferric uptake transcriptional regulator|nr:transcriptional repressor [Candidatus Obscuribacterales bacterium]